MLTVIRVCGAILAVVLLAVLPTGCSQAQLSSRAVLSGRVIEEDTQVPIPDARVVVAVPATEMRHLRESSNYTTYEAKTEKNGVFKIFLPLSDREFVSVDVFAKGFRSGAGTFMSGGDFTLSSIPVRPEQSNKIEIALPRALYVKGIVRDEQGTAIAGVKISGQLADNNSYGGIATALTDSKGQFEIFDFPLEAKEQRARLIFAHSRHEEITMEDIYPMVKNGQVLIDVVMPTGLMAAGRVLDVSGGPASGVKIEACLPPASCTGQDCSIARECFTDSEGRFELAGLKQSERILLTAYTEDFDFKAAKTWSPFDQNKNDLVLRLAPCQSSDMTPITLLGMKVADITPDLQKQFDIGKQKCVVILDPGENAAALGIGQPRPGNYFWMVGNKPITDIKEMIAEILRIHAKPQPQFGGMIQEGYHGRIRIVYSGKKYSNTQYLKLTDEQAEQLREVGKSLGMPEEQLNPPALPMPEVKQVTYDCRPYLDSLQPQPQDSRGRIKAIAELGKEIQTEVVPQGWDISGGQATVMYTESTLIIVQTSEIHEQIRIFLEKKNCKPQP